MVINHVGTVREPPFYLAKGETMPILFVTGLLLLVAVFLALSRILFWQKIQREVETLWHDQSQQLPQTYTPDDLVGLPKPVQTYLEHSIPSDQPYIQTVRLVQSGKMRLGPDQPWKTFTAEQVFTVNPPGFIWRAMLQFLPFIHVATRDKYMRQHGNMTIKILSALTIADAHHPNIDSAALIRYVAEMMWFPTAMVKNPYLRWEPVNDTSANAIMNDNGLEVTVRFHFSEAGDISHITADRFLDMEDAKPTPWYGYVRGYREFNGVRIPSEVEVGWEPDSGYYDWWHGHRERVE